MQTLYFQVIIKQTGATLLMNVSLKIVLDKQINVVNWAKRDGWQSIQNKLGIIKVSDLVEAKTTTCSVWLNWL